MSNTAPAITDNSPARDLYLTLDIGCPHCKEFFRISKIEGSYLNRRCPHCGGPIDSDSFDALATKTRKRQVAIMKASAPAETRVTLYRHRAEKCSKNRHRLFHAFWNWRYNRLTESLKPLRAESRAVSIELNQIAQARYYTSEWYLRTRIPLKKEGKKKSIIEPSYSKNGSFKLHVSTGSRPSWLAEYQVFDSLMTAARNPESPLYQAQILPNLYLPRSASSRSSGRLYDQIDCLVLTRQAAFVLEVKRRNTHVVTFTPFDTVYSTDEDDLLAYVDECTPGFEDLYLTGMGFKTTITQGIGQNRSHAITFMYTCSNYPDDAIYEQLVIVDPLSFRTDETGFANNLNVSYCTGETPAFVSAIEEECLRLETCLSQEDIDDLGCKYTTAYADLNQKRHDEHVRRIEELRRADRQSKQYETEAV